MKKSIIILFVAFSNCLFAFDSKLLNETIKILGEKSYYKKTELEYKLFLINLFKTKLDITLEISIDSFGRKTLFYNEKNHKLEKENINQLLQLFDADINGIITKYNLETTVDKYVVDLLVNTLDYNAAILFDFNTTEDLLLYKQIRIRRDLYSGYKIYQFNKGNLNFSDSLNLNDSIQYINYIPVRLLTHSLIDRILRKNRKIQLGFKNQREIEISLKENVISKPKISNITPSLDIKLDSCFLIMKIPYFINFNLKELISTVKKNKKNIKGVIIDLRSSNGGLLTSIAELSKHFCTKNSLLYTAKTIDNEYSINAINGGKLESFPLIILTNSETTNGSELFAMILKLNSNAKIIGDKTEGIGSIYMTYPVSSSTILKYKGGELILPNGKSLENNGIRPDIEYTKDDILEFAKKQFFLN